MMGMPKGKRVTVFVLAIGLLLGSMAGAYVPQAMADTVDSSGALIYAKGDTSVYVSPDGALSLSGVDPLSGETLENFTLTSLNVRPQKGSVAVGDDFIAYIDSSNSFGLATRIYVGGETPLAAAPKAGTEMEQVAAGSNHLLTLDDMAELRAVGENTYGQLGSADGGYVMEAQFIAAAEDVSFAIDLDNNLYAWGRNHVGQLGVGDKEDRREPVFVMSNVKEVWTSGSHTFARTLNGVLYGWGSNTSGQLGVDTNKKNVVSPRKIGSSYVSVAVGKRHTIFMDKYGGLYGAGSNQNYEMGRSKRESLHSIVDLKRTAQSMAAGDGFTLIVTMKTNAFAGSGRNDKRQLGLITKATFAKAFTRLTVPVNSVELNNMVSIAGEVTGVFADDKIRVTVNGGSYLAIGTVVDVTIPAEQVSGGANFILGDTVRVYFDGAVIDADPQQIPNTHTITLIKAA